MVKMSEKNKLNCLNHILGNDDDFKKLKQPYHCMICEKSFEQKKLYQITCSDFCEKIYIDNAKAYEDKIYNHKCDKCGHVFRKVTARLRGDSCPICRKKTNNLSNQIHIWVSKKIKKGIPLEELIRRQEWKRVFDDAGWDHYLKGRKWDKI